MKRQRKRKPYRARMWMRDGCSIYLFLDKNDASFGGAYAAFPVEVREVKRRRR